MSTRRVAPRSPLRPGTLIPRAAGLSDRAAKRGRFAAANSASRPASCSRNASALSCALPTSSRSRTARAPAARSSPVRRFPHCLASARRARRARWRPPRLRSGVSADRTATARARRASRPDGCAPAGRSAWAPSSHAACRSRRRVARACGARDEPGSRLRSLRAATSRVRPSNARG